VAEHFDDLSVRKSIQVNMALIDSYDKLLTELELFITKTAKESAGKRYGSSGSKIGNAHLKWAFSETAVLFLKQNAEGKKYHEKLKRKHGKGKALTILAHKLARAVYYMLKRETAFDMKLFLRN